MTKKQKQPPSTDRPTGATNDERLERLRKDPRFMRPRKKETKLKVDRRFQDMFEKEEFTTPYEVDRYGRKLETKQHTHDLKRFYHLEDEESETIDKGIVKPTVNLREAGSESESAGDGEEVSGVEELGVEKEEEPLMEDVLSSHPLVNTKVPVGDATARLAVVNLDWDQIRAADIYQLVHGFKPATGIVHSVKIYPSQFGQERMAKEAVEGPPQFIFKTAEDRDRKESERERGRERGSSDEEDSLDELESLKHQTEDDGHDFNEIRLRKYQLERLRYFYAVLECDSVGTAAALYRQCDGVEFEMSANFLDMRYIPDEVSFADEEPSDVASELGQSYNPKPALVTSALQQSKVKLTWDQDDPERTRVTKVNFGKMDFKEADLRAYLASSQSESESEADGNEDGRKGSAKEDRVSKYRELLLSGDSNVFGRKSHDDNEQLEITFNAGISDVRVHAGDSEEGSVDMEMSFPVDENAGDANAEDATVFDSLLRKRREKRKAKKQAMLEQLKVKQKAEREARKATGKRRRVVDDKKVAEMDLLLMDDTVNEGRRHFSLDEIIQAEKSEKKKKKNKHGKDSEQTAQADSFEIDAADARFQAIYESPLYSIDPTHPAFKRTKAMTKILEERQRQRK